MENKEMEKKEFCVVNFKKNASACSYVVDIIGFFCL